MKTQYYTATSIDGFIADADNSLEWLFQVEGDAEVMDQEYPDFMADVGAMAMGSTTYEWIANHTGFLDDPSKWEYTIPTWVFSSRELPRVEGPDIRFVSGDVVPVHAEMVEECFAADLEGLHPTVRAERLALLVAVTDVYTWALLRRRGGLGRKATEGAICGLINHARGDRT